MQRHADLTKAKTELGYTPTSIRDAIGEAYADFARRGLVPANDGDEGHDASTARDRRGRDAKATTSEKGLSA
jgi:hypothetical protein